MCVPGQCVRVCPSRCSSKLWSTRILALSSSPAQKPVTKIVYNLAKTTHSWAKNLTHFPDRHKAARWLNNYILKRIALFIVKVNLAPDVNVYLFNMHGWIGKLQSLHVTYGRGIICQSETSSLPYYLSVGAERKRKNGSDSDPAVLSGRSGTCRLIWEKQTITLQSYFIVLNTKASIFLK